MPIDIGDRKADDQVDDEPPNNFLVINWHLFAGDKDGPEETKDHAGGSH